MDAGIQKLRGFLTFGRDKDDHAQSQALRNLLDNLSHQPPLQAIAGLNGGYVPALGAISNLHIRFKLLENATPLIERCLPLLEEQVGDAPLPLDHSASQAALVADNFLKNIAQAYLELGRSIELQKLDSVLGHLLQNAARRAMQYLFKRQLLAYRAYATPSTNSWLNMHTLYRRMRGMHLAQGSGEHRTVEHTYLTALLLAYADPNKFRRDELQFLNDTVGKLAPLAILREGENFPADETPDSSTFFIADSGNAGCLLSKLLPGSSLDGHLILDCRSIVAAIDHALGKTRNAPPTILAPEPILIALRSAFGGQMTRRFQRQRFKPKAELVFGLSALIHFLDGQALARRQDDQIPVPEVPTSEWAILDESPDGFRLRYQKGEQQQCQAGDVVGLQNKGQSRIHICLLRRIANIGPNRLEVGLQEIASSGKVITLPISRQRAIFIPKLPGHHGKPGLLLLPGTMPPGGQVVIDLPERGPTRFHAAFCLEGSTAMELHLLEQLS